MDVMSDLQRVKHLLLSTGWTYVLSSTGNKSTGEYGLLFRKQGVSFWLNNKNLTTILHILESTDHE